MAAGEPPGEARAAAAQRPTHSFTHRGGEKLLTIELPPLESLAGVGLDVGACEVRLALPGREGHLLIPLPDEVSAGGGVPCAKFSRRRRELTIAWAPPELPAEGAAVPPAAPVPEAPTDEGLGGEAAAPPAPRGLAPEACAGGAAGVPAGDPAAEAHDRAPTGEACGGGAEAHPAPRAADPAGREGEQELGWTFVERCAPEEPAGCLDLLRGEVEGALKQCTVERLQSIAALRGCSVLLSEFDVEGEAVVDGGSCRFEASVSFAWEALDALGGFLGVSGVCRVPRLTAADSAPEVLVKVSSGAGCRGRDAAAWMKDRGAAAVADCLRGAVLAAGVLEAWSARTAEGAEPAAAEGDAVLVPPSPQSLSRWASAWLEEQLAAMQVRLFGGLATATFSAPQVSGDFGALRHGTSADETGGLALQLECRWAVASPGGRAEGTLRVPRLSPAAGAQGAEVLIEVAPGSRAPGQLVAALRQAGPAPVRALLARLLSELRARSGGCS